MRWRMRIYQMMLDRCNLLLIAEGEGPSSEAGPVGQLLTSQPDPPDAVECRVMGSTSGAICWLTPNSHGARILNYVIQYRKWVGVKEHR
jgi:hypothetical protein